VSGLSCASERGRCAPVAIHASRGPGRWFVMPRPKIAVCLLLAVVAAGALWAARAWSGCPIEVKVIDIERPTTREVKWVNVDLEFSRRGPDYQCHAKVVRILTRAEGRWTEPGQVCLLDELALWRTNCVRVGLMVPRQTETCRFLVAYNFGGPARTKAAIFLSNHGWAQRYPRICQRVLDFLPGRIHWKHATLHLALPPNNRGLALSPASAHNLAVTGVNATASNAVVTNRPRLPVWRISLSHTAWPSELASALRRSTTRPRSVASPGTVADFQSWHFWTRSFATASTPGWRSRCPVRARRRVE